MEGLEPKHDNEYFAEKEEGLMTHEITPKNRFENQIRLGGELFEQLRGISPDDMRSNEQRNEIMNFWTDGGKNSFAKAYADLEESGEFKFHPRLNGDIFKITVGDIIQYRETGTLPE